MLYYFDHEGQGEVTICGTARLLTIQNKKPNGRTTRKNFYPDREKDYLLIEVTPERLAVISENP